MYLACAGTTCKSNGIFSSVSVTRRVTVNLIAPVLGCEGSQHLSSRVFKTEREPESSIIASYEQSWRMLPWTTAL